MKAEYKIKHEQENPKKSFVRTIAFCPKCKSTNIIRRMAPAAIPNIGALWQMNVCNDCGFQDKIFPEIDEGNEDILEKVQKIFKKKK